MATEPSESGERLERVRIEQRYSTVRLAIRWIGIVLAALIAKEAVIAFAGQSTTLIIRAILSVLADFQFTVAMALTGATVVWAVRERALRRRKVENMQARIRKLEAEIDPGRTSSGLLPTGETNPADVGRI